MKKLILTLLLIFTYLSVFSIGIHTFSSKKDTVIFNLDGNLIQVNKIHSYEIIEPATCWGWNSKDMYKFCKFECVGKDFSKVFIKLIDKETYYIVQVYETGKPLKRYFVRKK